MPKSYSTVAAFALTTLVAPAIAQTPAPALQSRANELVAVLNDGGAIDALFAPSFLAQVPAAQVRMIAAQLRAAYGRAIDATIAASHGSSGATLRIGYERGTVDMEMTLDAAAPNRLIGLVITGSAANAQTAVQTMAALRALPGRTGFAFARLSDSSPQMLDADNADRPLAIGSAFKLVVLAELVRATAAGERGWSDLVTLGGQELPGGIYAQMPAGTRVSLRELAQKMISVSDNSATDILIATLGREKVEAMLPVVGIRDTARDRPFLTTLEAFKIKGVDRFARAWPTLEEAGRRALLKEIDATPNGAMDAARFAVGRPLLIDQAEWFASPADLVRVMDWLFKHSVDGAGAEARAILAINPGIARDRGNAHWSYIGYKGGSEPGVIGMTFLLQGKDGWYVLSSGWNNPAAPIEDGRFAALMMSTINGAGK